MGYFRRVDELLMKVGHSYVVCSGEVDVLSDATDNSSFHDFCVFVFGSFSRQSTGRVLGTCLRSFRRADAQEDESPIFSHILRDGSVIPTYVP